MTDLGALNPELLAREQGERRDEPSGLLVEHEYRPASDVPSRAGPDTQEQEEIGVHIDD